MLRDAAFEPLRRDSYLCNIYLQIDKRIIIKLFVRSNSPIQI